jgi:hypothetical protein
LRSLFTLSENAAITPKSSATRNTSSGWNRAECLSAQPNLAKRSVVADSHEEMRFVKPAKRTAKRADRAIFVRTRQVADTIGSGEIIELAFSNAIRSALIRSEFTRNATNSTFWQLASITRFHIPATKNFSGANQIINRFARTVTTERQQLSTADLAD